VKRFRPSFASVVALLALFVALGGPAQAAKLAQKVTSADVKDRSLKLKDLSRHAVRDLKTPRNGAVTEVKIANNAVTPAKIAPAAVNSAAIGDRSISSADIGIGAVTGTNIADGSLTARELGRYYGRFQLAEPIPALLPGHCWSGVPSGLAAERAKADISRDLVVVTPDSTWPQDQLTLTVKVESTQPKPGRFVLAACNSGVGATTPFRPSFAYLVIDLP
jgi:hypothetical protein